MDSMEEAALLSTAACTVTGAKQDPGRYGIRGISLKEFLLRSGLHLDRRFPLAT